MTLFFWVALVLRYAFLIAAVANMVSNDLKVIGCLYINYTNPELL